MNFFGFVIKSYKVDASPVEYTGEVFMTKIIKRIVKTANNAKAFLLLFGLVYIAGIVTGILFSTVLSKEVLAVNAVGFYGDALGKGGNVISLALSAFFADAVLLLIFYICSFVSFLIVIDLILIFYRAYVIASVAAVFIKLFGVSGLFLWLFCVFLRNFISFVALAYFASAVVTDIRNKCKNVSAVRNGAFILCAAVVFAAVLLEIVLLYLVLRPINLIF